MLDNVRDSQVVSWEWLLQPLQQRPLLRIDRDHPSCPRSGSLCSTKAGLVGNSKDCIARNKQRNKRKRSGHKVLKCQHPPVVWACSIDRVPHTRHTPLYACWTWRARSCGEQQPWPGIDNGPLLGQSFASCSQKLQEDLATPDGGSYDLLWRLQKRSW